MSGAESWENSEQALRAFKSEVEQMVLSDMNAVHDRAEVSKTVYHYTDLSGALAILESGHFWFTERAHLNDTLELQYGLRVAHDVFESTTMAAGNAIPASCAEHFKAELDAGLTEFGYWVASFSFESDDLSQWRSYADNGRGVCLGFSVRALDMGQFASNIAAASNYMRVPVRYDEAELRRSINPYIEKAVALLCDANLPTKPSYTQPHGAGLLFERDVLQTMMSGIYFHAMMHKHRAYQHEREFRLLFQGYRPKVELSPRHLVRARNGEIVSYLDLPMPDWQPGRVISEVRVGPAAPPTLETQLEMAFRSLGLSVPVVTRSELPYKAVR